MSKQFLGSKDAPIKIKEFFSLTCGHCSNFHIKTLPQLKKKYIDTGKVQLEFIDYPLDRLAVIAATLARSIPTKDGYIEAVSILLKKQKQWAYSKNPLNELQSIAKLFDMVLFNQLELWFKPYREQTGAHKGRGCIEHIVTL